MGKSPGKWIKTVLFGKKNSKSHMPKGREKIGNEKAVLVSAKGSEADAGVDFPDASNLIPKSVERNEGRSEINSKKTENISPDGNISFLGNQYTETQGSTNAPYDPERLKLEQAATKAQAAFRGYLARRAFWALKGIIRLQALIRGHLVRRQAVATLSSMLGIVKFQALVRGRIVRHSDIGLAVGNKCSLPKEYVIVDPAGFSLSTRMARFTANAYIFKLLATPPSVKPLHLHFDPEDQNSVSSWLERWSRSHFWQPIPQPKKQKESSKSQRKPSNGQTIDPHVGRSKRTRRLPVTNTDNASTLPSSEVEKPKRNIRKVPSHPPSDLVPENPQNELEKVKRSLRKVHNPVLIENPVQTEPEPKKPKEIFLSGHNNPLSEPEIREEEEETLVIMSSNSSDNKELALESLHVKEVLDEVTLNPNPLTSNPKDEAVEVEPKNQPEDDYKDENSPLTNGKLTQKENPMSNENLKSSRKNSLNFPSYMAATESAKAKLRAQGSPRFGQEVEKNNNSTVRRHSLPSLTNNGKISSQSPRTQRVAQSGGKGGIKSDKSVPAPKEGLDVYIFGEFHAGKAYIPQV